MIRSESWLINPREEDNMKNNIKVIRKQKGILQKELAEKVGVTHWWLSNIENGLANPGLQLMIRIADTLDVTIDELCK